MTSHFPVGERLKSLQIARRFLERHWGGTETVLLESSRRLPALGVDSEIWCTSAFSQPGRDRCLGLPVRRYRHYYPYLGLSAAARQAFDLKGGNSWSPAMFGSLLRCRGLQLLHLHTGNRLGAGARTVARLRGIPYVLSLHGGYFDMPAEQQRQLRAPGRQAWDLGKPLGWLLGARRLVQDAQAVICVGFNEYQIARQRLSQRVEFLPNGVDVAHFGGGSRSEFRRRQGFPEEDFVILLVGRIDPQKGQLGVVESWPQILEANPRARLVLAGEGSDPVYQAQVEALLGRLPRVKSLGALPTGSQALLDAYRGSDTVLIPSHYEPLGIVALEAWASGVPVLARRVGGLGHLVSDGVNGLHFESDVELPALLARLADSLELRQQLAGRAREQVRNYDWDVFARRTAGLYFDLVESARATVRPFG